MAFSGETDTVNGSGAFSIQTNTNFFTGLNKDWCWVQFVLQNYPNEDVPQAPLCVWVFDVTENDWTHTVCMYVPIQYLSSTYRAGIWGYAMRGHSQYVLSTIAIVPAGDGNIGIYSVVAVDVFGLHANWHAVTGTILGAGSGSQANFTSPTTVVTTIVAAYSGAAIPTLFDKYSFLGKLAVWNGLTVRGHSVWGTGETNNLCFPPAPTILCGRYSCWIEVTYKN